MKKIFNNNYFSFSLIPGFIFGVVVDDGIVYIMIGFISFEIKTFNFFRKRRK